MPSICATCATREHLRGWRRRSCHRTCWPCLRVAIPVWRLHRLLSGTRKTKGIMRPGFTESPSAIRLLTCASRNRSCPKSSFTSPAVFSCCKGIDTFCPLGPWIVTADEIPEPHNLAMELRVNGESRQRSHSGKMSVKIPEILSHYSPMGYSAGDVVSTGTVSGVAAFSGDPKAWYLRVGDVMECEIEKIGILRNRVISWGEAYGHKAAAMATQEALK